MAELGYELRDSKPAVTERVIQELQRLAPDAVERFCGVVLSGHLHWRQEEFLEAADCVSEAVAGLAGTDLKIWLVRARSLQSGIALSLGLHHEGISTLLEALEVAADLGDQTMLFALNHNLAAALGELGDVDSAERRFAMAEVFASPDTDDLQFLEMNRCSMYLLAKRPHQARAILDKSAHLWADPTPSQARTSGLQAQCSAALAVGELADAVDYLERAMECSAALGRTSRTLSITECRVYLAQGHIDKAKTVSAQIFYEQQNTGRGEGYDVDDMDLLRLRADIAEAEGDFETALHLEREVSGARIELLTKNNHEVNLLLLRHHTKDLELQSQQLATQNDQLGSVVSELQMKTTEALELTYRDFLTGLHNRRYLHEEAARILDPLRPDRGPVSVLVMDVDDFKAVNDNHLHAIGDRVLKKLAELMLDSARKSDLVCRHGGDEFVMLMPATTLAEAETFAERLAVAIEAAPWGDLADGLQVTMTCGAAEAHEGDTLESLTAAADRKMLTRKRERSVQG